MQEIELCGAQTVQQLIECEFTIRRALKPSGSAGSAPRRIREVLEKMSFVSLVGLVRSYVGGHLGTLLLQTLEEMREEAKEVKGCQW